MENANSLHEILIPVQLETPPYKTPYIDLRIASHLDTLRIILDKLPWATIGGSISLLVRGLLDRSTSDIDLTVADQDYTKTVEILSTLSATRTTLKAESLASVTIGAQHRSMAAYIGNSSICVFARNTPFGVDHFKIAGMLVPLTGLNTVLQAKIAYSNAGNTKHTEDLKMIYDTMQAQSLQAWHDLHDRHIQYLHLAGLQGG